MDISVLQQLCQQCSNWGKWGSEDEVGTLNYITPEKVVSVTRLANKGKTFGLAIPFGNDGPQRNLGGRFNPIHLMIADGSDPGSLYADDVIVMPLQCATQWDALAHIFWNGKMWARAHR